MLPKLEPLLAGYALYAQQNGFVPDRDEVRLSDALLELTTDLAILELMRARILRDAIGFEALRDWFADHLAPIPRRPWPPR